MQEISNSLRQRLGARPQPQTHPDPDTLSAYVEQVLSPAERVRIVEHLADCRDCREVVALSLPQLEPQQPVLQTAPRSRWWAPASRWATLAATIAVATTLIVERPWQKQSPNTPSRQQQAAAPSGKTESANASANQTADLPTLSEPDKASRAATVARSNALVANDRLQDTKTPAESGRNTSENPPLPRAARRTTVGGVVGGVPAGTSGLAVQQAVAPATLMAHQPAMPPPPRKETDGELRNRDAASVNGAASKETVEVTAADAVLPVAPAPQPAPTPNTASVRRFTPPLSATPTNTMQTEIVPPNVSSTGPPPSAKDNTLSASSLGKKGKPSKIKTAESTVVDAAKRVMEAANPVKPPSGVGQGFAGTGMATPPREDADTRSEFRQRELPQQLHWRIQNGTLQKSTDFTQWHEAYAQSPVVQFRFVEPRGSEVWAGGNHGTLIHSWNAGVDWSKMNVPASTATDITAISIDGDNVQVKTSNGQTFVSTDHGQTWVPLEQPK